MTAVSTVALVRCDDYSEENVYKAVSAAIELSGGTDDIINKDEKILLKPNLLTGALPQKAVTTHPAVFEAVIRVLKERGCTDIEYGDSPGNPVQSFESAAKTAGLSEIAERYGVKTGDFTTSSNIKLGAHQTAVCRSVIDCGAMINICKMKTHALERITGAVKNLYGCVQGANKALGHARFPSADAFADHLCEIHKYVKPRLHIMDGVTAMEGNGPTSGTPINMNVILASRDPVALDAVYCALIKLDPELVPTNTAGYRHGIGTYKRDEIAIVTPEGTIDLDTAFAKFGKSDFDVPRGGMRKTLLGKFIPLMPVFEKRPYVKRDKCTGCGLCMQACPVPEKAVRSGSGKKAVYDYSKCIRCFCCQEMCPSKAIGVRSGFKRT